LPISPPRAARRPTLLVHGGDARIDDWQWLRDADSAEARAYLEAENAYVERCLQPLTALRERLAAEIADRMLEADVSAPVRKGAWEYYARTIGGSQHAVHCRRPARPRGAPAPDVTRRQADEVVFLDENRLAAGSDVFRLWSMALSPDQMTLAYVVDVSNDETPTLRVRDLASGRDLPDELQNASAVAWTNDGRNLLYLCRSDLGRDWQLRRHELGTAQDADHVLLEEHDERFRLELRKVRSGRYVVITSSSYRANEIYVLDADRPESDPRLLLPRRPGVKHQIEHHQDAQHGSRFFALTNADEAVNFKLLAAADDDHQPMSWHEFVGSRDDVQLERVDAFAHHLVLTERKCGIEQLRVLALDGSDDHLVTMPEALGAVALGTNLEFDTTTIRYRYTSLVTPLIDVDYDMETRRANEVKRQAVPDYDPGAYESFRTWATAQDGTRIPISVVRSREAVRPSPTLLYGYGGYGLALPPIFDAARLSLLERGVVFAIAHVRGGGELGPRWHEAGRGLSKRATFTDFIACADHLVATGVAAGDRLAANGTSAGGLLMGAVANLAPTRFQAIVAEVPFVDCLTTLLDPTMRLTPGEWEEWGDVRQEPASYSVVKSYSPYDNVERLPYPAMLVTAGLHDVRVPVAEPAKWVAKLRTLAEDDSQIYLHTNMRAGHFGLSGRHHGPAQAAFALSFILDRLGVEPSESTD
jgi:oligopeptidase B